MALVYQKLTLEVTPGMIPPVLHVTEYDINMQIDVTFTQRGQPYEIPSGTTAKVEGTLAGHPFRESCVVNGNTATFILTKNMTAYAGRAWTKIVLTNSSWPVSTCGFWLDVDCAGVEAETVIGAPGFEEQIKQGVTEYLDDHQPFFTLPEGGEAGQALLSDGAGGAVWGQNGGGTGLSDTAKSLILYLFGQAIYESDISEYLSALEAEFNSEPTPTPPPTPGEVTVTQSGTSLIFSNVPAITNISQSGTTLALS